MPTYEDAERNGMRIAREQIAGALNRTFAQFDDAEASYLSDADRARFYRALLANTQRIVRANT